MATREIYPLVQIDDTFTLIIPREWTGNVTALLGAPGGNTPVGFTGALEITVDDSTWEPVTFTKADQTTAASLTQGVSGSFDCRAYVKARIRVTAAVSGTCGARLEFRKGR